MTNQNSNDSYSVQTWSNSLDYLQKIAHLENLFIEANLNENVDKMVLTLRSLYMLLKRMLKSKKGAKSKDESKIFEKEQKQYLLDRIQSAKIKYDKSRHSTRGSIALKKRNNRLYEEALEELRTCFEDLGDFQLANDMTFKEGQDPNEAWAMG